MADNYSQATPHELLNCTEEEHKELSEALNPDEDYDFHGFEASKYDGFFFFYAEESYDEDSLPEVFLNLLGKLIKKNSLNFITIGYCYYCSKMRPEEFGGGTFRIYPDGSIIYPEIKYPE